MITERARTLPWPTIAALGVGGGLGWALGARFRFLAGAPSGGWFPPTFEVIAMAIGLVGLLGLGGLVLLLPRSTRPAGRFGLLATAGMIGGLLVGSVTGPAWLEPRSVDGRVTVTLAAPVGATFEADARCTTEANGDRVVTLSTALLGRVGLDDLGLRLDIGATGPTAQVPSTMGRIALDVDQRGGYDGSVRLFEVPEDSTTGRGEFFHLGAGRFRIGGAGEGDGPRGIEAVSGTVVWDCDDPAGVPGPTDDPTVEVRIGGLQGWFTLDGLVSMPHPCDRPGPCLPYGHTIGVCTSAADLRVESLDTVVPWTDGRRARLHLVPGRTSATLTVEVDDGSAPETVTAAATLEETSFGSGIVGRRSLSAAFPLHAGVLELSVEWECGDSLEMPR